MLKTKKRYDCAQGCPVEATLDLIGGKWKTVILHRLFAGPLRFSELRRSIPTVTQRVLTRQLRELEEAGLVARTVYPRTPPHVEYALTPEALSLQPIITAMHEWGVERLGPDGRLMSAAARLGQE
jgi:DNA-binding HxlR family transcriptional regulator